MLNRIKKPKIFIIGFNKTGTQSLHHLLKMSGIAAAHNTYLKYRYFGPALSLAKRMKDNRDRQKPILNGLESITAFSDLTFLSQDEIIEANGYFRDFHSAYPDSYTIFNDRSVEGWVTSRAKHRNGGFLNRYAKATGLSHADVMSMWTQQYHAHREAVLSYFQGHSRFLHFDITQDNPKRIADLLTGDFNIKLHYWGRIGGTPANPGE